VLAYNAENQLKSVTVPGVSVSTYDYDYIGHRVRKSVDLVSGDDYVVTWVYSGWNKIEERKTVGGVTTTKHFVWGLDLSQSTQGAGGVGGLLASVDASGTNLFSYGGDGNVSELIAASTGNLAAHYEYDAFGNSVLTTGPFAAENPYRFSTKYLDAESGYYYYGYRYYDAALGRWTQRDPIGELGGTALYAFVGNRAMNGIDARGLFDPESFGEGALDAVREPLALVHDGILVALIVSNHAINGGEMSLDVPVRSKTMKLQLAAARAGASPEEITPEASQVALPLLTLGLSNIATAIMDYYDGKISLEELDRRLSHTAGGLTLVAVTAKVASRSSSCDPKPIVVEIPPRTSAPPPPAAPAAASPVPVASGGTQAVQSPHAALAAVLRQRQRVLELSFDSATGRNRVSQGIGGTRYEQATGRMLELSADPAVDFVDPQLGGISLKGPLRNAATGEPIPITDAMVEGLGRSVVKDATMATGTDAIVVDTLGMSPTQVQALEQQIQPVAAKKPIIILE